MTSIDVDVKKVSRLEEVIVKTKGIILLSGLVMILALPGCVVLVAGGVAAGGAVVYMNKVEDTVSAPVPQTHAAARDALTRFGLVVIEDSHDLETGRLKSRYADGKSVWVSLEAVGPANTDVTVRVGVVGETGRAHKIMNAIRSNLAEDESSDIAASSE